MYMNFDEKHSPNVLEKDQIAELRFHHQKSLIYRVFCALFEQIPSTTLNKSRYLKTNPTWCGYKNSNNLCAPSHLVTWIPHTAIIYYIFCHFCLTRLQCLYSHSHPSRHSTWKQRWFNVKTLNQRWIDVVSTLCFFIIWTVKILLWGFWYAYTQRHVFRMARPTCALHLSAVSVSIFFEKNEPILIIWKIEFH